MVSEDGNARNEELAGQVDKTRAYIKDTDTPLFREQSTLRVHGALERILGELAPALQERQPEPVRDVLVSSSETLARSILDAGEDQDILALPNSGIVHQSGRIQWIRPDNPRSLEAELFAELATRFCTGDIDIQRLAEGAYLLQVLNHKYVNGNGRVGRSLKLLIEKANNTTPVTKDDTRRILGVGEEAESPYAKRDQVMLLEGLEKFGEEGGWMTSSEMTSYQLRTGLLTESALLELSRKAGIEKSQLKRDFIKFMVAQSDLSWRDFENLGLFTSESERPEYEVLPRTITKVDPSIDMRRHRKQHYRNILHTARARFKKSGE